MSVKVIFSFDSEDYETPAADDAEKWWAEAMTRHGITACICVVGELARALRERGRKDVIAAMARHEIAFHSDMHSAHPTWAEYLDTLDWDQGVTRALREESRGIADVEDVFGQHPSAWCKPGLSWGPPVAHAMAQMDVPVFCDAPFEAALGRPLWYDNNLLLCYHAAFDDYFGVPRPERLGRMQADLAARAAQHDGGYLVMYTHPCRLFTARFTDTFRHGRNPPRTEWGPCPLRPESEIRGLQEDFDSFLAWIVRQPDIELTTYRALFAEFRPPPTPWLAAEDVRQLCRAGGELDYRPIGGEYLSPAEQFGVVARAACALTDDARWPDHIPVRRLLGPTQTPPECRAPGRLSWAEFTDAARWADAFCSQTRTVPATIPAGGGLGPNAFFQAAAGALCAAETGDAAPRSIEIRPVAEYPAITRRDDFRLLQFRDSWSIFPPEFEGANVLEMIRLQAWTAKPALARR